MLSVLQIIYKPSCLILIALLGLACGHLIDTIVEMSLSSRTTITRSSIQQPKTEPNKISENDLNLILQNNLFDADNRSATKTISSKPSKDVMENSAKGFAQADLKLVGTIVGPEDSLVLLQVDQKLALYHQGEEITGGRIVEEIRRNEVAIRNRDRSLSTLRLHENNPLSEEAPAGPLVTAREFDGQIRQSGEAHWLISQNTVDSVRENFADQLRLAQMQPRIVDGRTNGFLIMRINPRSILHKLGLQKGDVVLDVNRIMLDSPEKALQIFQQLREARQIEVAIERDGRPMSLTYEIK